MTNKERAAVLRQEADHLWAQGRKEEAARLHDEASLLAASTASPEATRAATRFIEERERRVNLTHVGELAALLDEFARAAK